MLPPHTHPFNGPLSRATKVSRNHKGKPIWILLEQEIVSGSGISWVVCKSAPRSRQITMPAPHHSVFYRPDALPAAQPTVSKHWRHAAPFKKILDKALALLQPRRQLPIWIKLETDRLQRTKDTAATTSFHPTKERGLAACTRGTQTLPSKDPEIIIIIIIIT